MSSRRTSKRRLRFEQVESRLLLSATAAILNLPDIAALTGGKTISALASTSRPTTATAATSTHATSTSTTSSNWAGYAAQTSLASPASDAVTSVSGTWQVPSITSSSRSGGYTAVWVGIDGYSSSTVEQIGTESEIVNGRVVNYAWYEMYPDSMVTLSNVKINAGDTISAEVDYVTSGAHAGQFMLTIADVTTNTSATVYQTAASAERSSAEWIVEAPSSGSGLLPLANFSSVTFSQASATIGGVTGAIDGGSWETARINMVSGTTTKATTSALTDSTASSATSSFVVSYGSGTTAAVAPSGYSIKVDMATITASQAKSTGFTLKGGQVGATYNYTITSSGGGTAVTNSGTVTSTTQHITGIDVSGLANGTLTFSVTLSNSAGTGKAATAKAVLKQSVPSGYTIRADAATITASQAKSTGFTLQGAQVGATYMYSITSSGGGTAVTNSGTVTSTTQHVTGIDVSGLPNGTLTFSVTLANAVGTGKAATAKAILKQAIPSGYAIRLDNTTIDASKAKSTGFTITGAEVGATYTYSITSSGGDGVVTGTGKITSASQRVKQIDVSGLPNGTLTISVTLTNVVGTGTAATATATLNQVAPSGYTIKADNATITSQSAAKAAGFTFTGAEVGATYTYSITSSGGDGEVTGTGTVTSAAQDVKGIDVSSLANGTLTFSVTLTNGVGDGPQSTATATLAVVASATDPTTSTNWSGYAVQTDLTNPESGAVTSVSGSWVVPAVTGSGTAYSSVWVGIDGYSSSSVEQIGTDSDLVNGQPVYYAWYEMYPSASVTIPVSSLAIQAGDAVSAQVQYVTTSAYPQGAFVLSIVDSTSGSEFSITLPDTISSGRGRATTQADRSSAEWVVEAPSSGYGVLPLANFGSVTFTDASATIGGTTGSIGNSSWQSVAINMVSGSSTIATTSALDSTGSSFSVSFTGSTSVSPPWGHWGWPWGFSQWQQTNAAADSSLAPSPAVAGISAAQTLASTGQSASDSLAAAPKNAAIQAAGAVDSALAALYRGSAGLADGQSTEQAEPLSSLFGPSTTGTGFKRPGWLARPFLLGSSMAHLV